MAIVIMDRLVGVPSRVGRLPIHIPASGLNRQVGHRERGERGLPTRFARVERQTSWAGLPALGAASVVDDCPLGAESTGRGEAQSHYGGASAGELSSRSKLRLSHPSSLFTRRATQRPARTFLCGGHRKAAREKRQLAPLSVAVRSNRESGEPRSPRHAINSATPRKTASTSAATHLSRKPRDRSPSGRS